MATTGSSPQAFRRNGVRLFLTACGALGFLCTVGSVVSTFDTSNHLGSLRPVWQVLSVAFVVLVAWFTIGVFRQGIWTDSVGVTVQNIFRRYNLAWDQIATIEAPLPYPALRNSGIGFRLQDGGRVNAALYAAGALNRPAFATTVIGELQDELTRYAGHPGTESAVAVVQRRRDAIRSDSRFWIRYAWFGLALSPIAAVCAIATADWYLFTVAAASFGVGLRIIRRWRERSDPGPESPTTWAPWK
jgi:FtsH-binding integral membrane protein